MPLMFNGGRLLFSSAGQLAWSANCCCDACCGCAWLTSYWQSGGRLRVTFTGAFTGYIILGPQVPPDGSCLYWSGDDVSNISDDCALFPQGASVSCVSSNRTTAGIILGFGTGSGTCELSELSQTGADCGPPLLLTYTATVEEITSGGCVCALGTVVTFSVEAEDL